MIRNGYLHRYPKPEQSEKRMTTKQIAFVAIVCTFAFIALMAWNIKSAAVQVRHTVNATNSEIAPASQQDIERHWTEAGGVR